MSSWRRGSQHADLEVLLGVSHDFAVAGMIGCLDADDPFADLGLVLAEIFGEFRLGAGSTDYKAGDQVLVSDFKPSDMVDVIGVSKGRGFAGVVKRHHFRGGEGSHGSMFHRAPGSIGASSFPSRVFPGTRMAGHSGTQQVTVRNLEIVDVDAEDNVLMVKGAVPGPNGGYVLVRRAKR